MIQRVSAWYTRALGLLHREPAMHWSVVCAFCFAFFLCYRLLALDAIVKTFGSNSDDTFGVKLLGLLLGFCEDFVCVTYLATLLWTFDSILSFVPVFRASAHKAQLVVTATKKCERGAIERIVRFLGYFSILLFGTIHFVANGLLIRIRQMRFTLQFIEMYFNQRDAVSSLQVSDHEQNETEQTVIITVAVLLAFSAFTCKWLDLSHWNPTRLLFADENVPIKTRKSLTIIAPSINEPKKSHMVSDYRYNKLEQGELTLESLTPSPESDSSSNTASMDSLDDVEETISNTDESPRASLVSQKLKDRSQPWRPQRWERWIIKTAFAAFFIVFFPLLLLEFVQENVSPVVTMIGLNTSLSEVFRLIFGEEFLPELTDGTIESAAFYLDSSTEEYTLFKSDALYRRTTGFKGDLAFDVQVDQEDLPNVLVLAIESFRYHDSQYLVGNNTYLLHDKNITVTPNFDRWAKRGISFRNMWSSWQTSRSLESILFAQLPFNSVTKSGTTTGRADVELSGMPQLFKAKGYEPTFSTGCRTDYDQWDKFLPSHGFDEVLNMTDIKRIAEKELGIDPNDWALTKDGGKSRAMRYWGVHDDVSFEVLGNILTNKTDEQKARVKNNEPKKPFFINHYTITSHTSYEERPQWYENYTIPDFSPLWKDEPHGEYVKKYLELRYFQDMALGKFMDRMQKQGILNDTIVVIVGDHGQAPEFGTVGPEYREMSTARVAATLIAEGRLGKYAGMMVDRVGEHYDLLNTLADIVGLPEGGLIQTGVGRSLKRKAPSHEAEQNHVVWSNNPVRKMAVVRGHLRLQYDVMTSVVALHDTDKDHDMKHNLFPDLPPHEKKEWMKLRDAGRRVSAYFKHRLTEKCLLKIEC